MSQRNFNRHRKPPQRPQHETRLYVSRPVLYSPDLTVNRDVAHFANEVGRATKGEATLRSLGSMAVTLMNARDFSNLRSQITTRDRANLSSRMGDFVAGLNEHFEPQQGTDFHVRGLALYGRGATSPRPGEWTTIGFKSSPEKNPDLQDDIQQIKTYFSDNNLPEPNISHHKLHISIGQIRLHRVVQGHNYDPHVLIPSGVTIPSVVSLGGVQAEEIDG